jgi:hypothetical protein
MWKLQKALFALHPPEVEKHSRDNLNSAILLFTKERAESIAQD